MKEFITKEFRAYQFLSKVMAGLNMWDVREDGEIEWYGTDKQWDTAKMNEQLFEEGLLPN
jgi:hypothetical protein